MQEPKSGWLLCGADNEQQLYVRDNDEAKANAEDRPGHTLEDCWFNVADGTDIYRYADLLRDYGPENVKHLVACADYLHGCPPNPR